MHDANQGVAEELLRKHEIDFAITELQGRPTPPIQSCTLVRLPLVLVVPKEARVHKASDLFHRDAAAPNLISLPADEVISKHFHAGLRKLGIAWPSPIEVSSLELIDLYTSLGLGVGLSVAVPRGRRIRGLRVLSLPRFPPLAVAALWIGDLSDLAATFLCDIKILATRLGR